MNRLERRGVCAVLASGDLVLQELSIVAVIAAKFCVASASE